MNYIDNILTVIYTVDRSENYLGKTIADLKDAGIKKAVISQGSRSDQNLIAANLDSYNITVDYPQEVLLNEDFDKQDVRYKAQVNYINALRTHPGESAYRLVIEDDVHASKRNTVRVLNIYLRAVRTLEKNGPFILSLYTPYIGRPNGLDVHKINIDSFYGMQACLFSESICRHFAKFIEDRISTEPHDYLIKHFCKESGINIYGASYSLFQHTGVQTTGLGHHHTTGNFIGD